MFRYVRNPRASIADRVICQNCDTRMLVDVGREDCPVCGEYGGLMWVDKKHSIVVLTFRGRRISDLDFNERKNP